MLSAGGGAYARQFECKMWGYIGGGPGQLARPQACSLRLSSVISRTLQGLLAPEVATGGLGFLSFPDHLGLTGKCLLKVGQTGIYFTLC